MVIKEKEEVDFLITENANPLFMVEAKLLDTTVSPHLVKFQNILRIPAIQLVNKKMLPEKSEMAPTQSLLPVRQTVFPV